MKWNKKHIIGLVVILLVTALTVGGIALWMRETRLEQIQNEALAELDRNAGQYDEQSIVLHDTSKARAEELAKLYGAKLRITADGKFATLTLPEGTTIRDVYAMDESRAYIEEMAADYHVQAGELTGEETDGERLPTRPQYEVADSDYELQGYLDYLNMGYAWASYTGSGITVAVIDTGIDTDHPEFAGRISEYSYNATQDKIVKDYNDWSLIEDEQGHGTAVTGVIAAAMDGSGIVGIAPNVEIIVIKAECDANGSFLRGSDLIFGLYYAIERDARVVNMSFGTYASVNPFADAVQLAYDSDIICVAAAGNDSTSRLCWPAADEHVIGVGALNGWELADYSNFGENVDLCAPGTTYTTLMDGKYGNMTGTSLASPIAAGAMALLLQNNPYITFDDVAEILYASCYDLGDLGRDWYYGFGALDMSALLLEERGKITYDMLTDELENMESLFIQGHPLQELPEPERLYAVFDGWYYDDTFTQEYNYYVDKFYGEEVTLYAKWVNEDDGVPYTYVVLDDGTVEIRSYTGHRRYITIPEIIEGRVVSSIGDSAFAGQTRLREVNLPSGLTHIGQSAFQGCTNLLNIKIPENVTEIGEGAFSSNVRLSTVAFLGNSKLETVGREAFADCGRLERIELPASLKQIDGSAFYGATALYQIGVQSGNTAYKSVDGVLYDCSGSTLVAFPAAWGTGYELLDTTTHIGMNGFAYAKLTEMDITGVVRIGEGAFANAGLESIHIPDSVTIMEKAAFSGCKNLAEVTLGRGLTDIAWAAFDGCGMKHITIPNGIRYINLGAFAGSSLEVVTFEENSTLEVIEASAFYETNLHEIDIPASVVRIGDYAFSGDFIGTPLTRVGFADNAALHTIGEGAFAKCWLLETVTLPNQLQTIDRFAFQSSGLTQITLPASVTVLGEGAFSLCGALTAVTVEAGNPVYRDMDGVVYTLDDLTVHTYPSGKAGESYALQSATQIVGPWAFAGAVNLNWVELPEGLVQISEYGFAYCERLQYMYIPDAVLQIGRYAFAHDWQLTSVSFNETAKLPRLSYGAFAYSGLMSFRVPANVSTMAQGVFEGCRNLGIVTFAADSKLESISAYMFDGCNNLYSIVFEPGSALTSIQAHGLEGMANLSYIDFGDAKLTNIDNFAFRFCENLYELNLPETVTNIGRYAFYGCKNLSALTIPEAINHIGSYAFLGTNDMEVFFQSENLPAYLDENWDSDTKGYYTGMTEVAENADYRYAILSSGNIAILEYLGTETVVDLTKVDLGGNITIIGGSAFENSAVTSVILPDTLAAIQAEAFAHSALTSVKIPAGVTFIGREAFAYTDIAVLTFGENAKLDVIEQYAFEGTEYLTAVTLPASVTKLGTGVFLNSGLQSVVFADGIQLAEIPQKAFAETKLTSVALPDSVTLVNHDAFNNVQTLKSVTFGNNDGIRLMSNAFYHTGLTSLHIPANVTYIGEYCFVALSNLTEFAVDENNPNYKAEDGLLLTKNGHKLIAVPAGRTGSLTVPLCVEVIGFGAFEESKLSEILFHEDANILTFGYRAFFRANNLSTIIVPKSVVSIDYYAFAYCENLREVNFVEGNQLKGIYEGAFLGCGDLEQITLPDTIVEISDFAFYGCGKITKLPMADTQNLRGIYDYAFAYSGLNGEFILPENVLDIGNYAFMGTKLERVTIPNTNRKDLVIGFGAFEDCNSLEEITLPFLGPTCEDEDRTWLGYIFGAGSYWAHETYVPESLKTVTLFDGVTTLGEGAFAECSHLQTINLPHSVTVLGSNAFFNVSARYSLTNTISFTGETVFYAGNISGHLTLAEGYTYVAVSSPYLTGLTLPESVRELSITDATNLTELTLPEGVTTVYLNNLGITKIAFPNSVTAFSCAGCRELKTVHFPEGMTELGDGVFAGCTGLERIELPETLTKIGYNAFAWCSSLSEIRIPDSVTLIDEGAFQNCTALTGVIFPQQLERIAQSAFYGCTSLTSLVLPQQLERIDQFAFGYCTALNSVTLPQQLKVIGDWAFECPSLYEIINYSDLELTFGSMDHGAVAMNARWIIDRDGNKTTLLEGDDAAFVDTADGFRFLLENGEYTLVAYMGTEETITLPQSIQGNPYRIYHFRGGKHIILPEGMTTIDEHAFYMHTQMESIEIPDTVTEIRAYAFYNCRALKNVELPSSLTSLGVESFSSCRSLETVDIPAGLTDIYEYAFMGCSALRKVNFAEGLQVIRGGAFSGTALTAVNIPASVCEIMDGAFGGCPLETVTVDEDNRYYTAVDNILYNKDMTKLCAASRSITYALIPASVEEISSGAFNGCAELKTVEFEAGSRLRWIGMSAFAECTALETIHLPQNLEVVESVAFGNCTALTSIQLPDALQSMGTQVFAGCTGLTEMIIPANLTEFTSTFDFCDNLQALHVDPANPAYASCDGIVYNKALTQIVFIPLGLQGSVTIPEGVTVIPAHAFYSRTAITEIKLPDGLTAIENGAFYGCTSLQRIDIPDSVASIGEKAFEFCTNLQEVILPNGITKIEWRTFWNCISLLRVVIPDTVTEIGESAFEDCISLNAVNMPRHLTRIGNYAFKSCAMRYIDIPEGVESIGDWAFYYCRNLLSVTLPQSLQQVGIDAFGECYNLAEIRNNSDLSITFGSAGYGCVAQYARAIVDKNGNRTLLDGSAFFAIHKTEDGLIFKQDGEQYTLVAYAGEADTVTLPLTFNGSNYDIYELQGIRHLILPEGMERIPWCAFTGYQLESVVIPNTVTTIEDYAFQFTGLTSVVIPDSVTHVGRAAFRGCENLRDITIGEGVTFIHAETVERTAFAKDPANWVDGCLYLDRYLLDVDENAITVTVREDTQLVAGGAFENCHKLKVLQTGILEWSTIAGCTNLETLILTRTVDALHGLPMTVKNIVLGKDFVWDRDHEWFFNGVGNITIFTESKEAQLRWDDNYPGWNWNLPVVYGENWIWANFYDREGNLIQSTPQRISAIVRLPYVKDEVGYAFAGWDLDGDGIADSVPATSTVDIYAYALFERVCDHNVVIDEAVAPTCTETGLTEGKHCDLCGEVFVAQKEIAATGHSHEVVVTEPTCTEDGSRVYTCHCGDTYTEVIPAIGHDYASVVTAPTCTEDGYTTHTCGNCGATYTDNHVEALGHAYEAEVTAPTCTEGGYTTYTCHCGDSYVADHTEATGHNWDEGVVTKEATCTEPGVMTYTCVHCGYSYTEEIPTAPHSFVDGNCENCGAPELEPGDVNGDGRLNARDARALLRYLAGMEELSEAGLAAADFNGDGRVNARDARAILQALAGIG